MAARPAAAAGSRARRRVRQWVRSCTLVLGQASSGSAISALEPARQGNSQGIGGVVRPRRDLELQFPHHRLQHLLAHPHILGHHYQKHEVIRFADITGDSFLLARRGAEATQANLVVFLGVYFMAEAADILRAGLPMHQGMLNYFDRADNAFISA